MFEIGDVLVITRHGTDHSFEEKYFINKVDRDNVYMSHGVKGADTHFLPIGTLCERLNDEYSDYRIIKARKPYKLDEELFTI